MSDGDIGGGLSFWATISIQGTLKKEQLNAVMTEVKKILNNKVTAGSSPVVGSSGDAINGEVRHAARIANTTAPEVSVSFRTPDAE